MGPQVQNRLQELQDVLTEFQVEYEKIQEEVNSLGNDWESLKKDVNQVSTELDLTKETMPTENIENDSHQIVWGKRQSACVILEKMNEIENKIDFIEGELVIF